MSGSIGSLAIKPLVASDLTAAAKLWFESWRSTGMNIALRETEATFEERIRQEFARWEAYLALEGTPVGFLALVMQDACLDQLFIAPQAQRRGIGRALPEFAKQRLPDGFWLHAGVDNPGACAFYDAHGLRRVRLEPHPRLGIPMIVYEWRPPHQ